jgi:SH3-like domain-containing protein
MHGNQRWTLAILPLGMVLLAILACGGFQVRVTPTAGPTKTPGPAATPVAEATSVALPTAARTAGPTPKATPTATPNSAPVLAPGKMARVAADLVNVRAEAKSGANKTGMLLKDSIVTLRGGPVVADNLTWYQVDNGSGVTGWVASGPPDSPWLVPESGTPVPTRSGARLVDRAIKVGDLIQVTTKEGQPLAVRDSASKSGEAVAYVMPGTQFTVKGGPTKADGATWWQIEGEEVKGWTAEGDSETRWLTPLE